MRAVGLLASSAALAACTDAEPLAPPFAGEWSPRQMACHGPRVTIGKNGIAATGMPINGLVFTKKDVSGSTAHVTMEIGSNMARVADAMSSDPRAKRELDEARNIEIVATLVASTNYIAPTNVMFRDKTSRQLRAANRDVLAIMTLVRCSGRGNSRSA